MLCGHRRILTLEVLPYIMDFFMSLTPFLAAIFDHWRGRYSIRKSRNSGSHFIVTSERGSGRRKCALNEAATAYSHDSEHDGGSEREEEKRIKTSEQTPRQGRSTCSPPCIHYDCRCRCSAQNFRNLWLNTNKGSLYAESIAKVQVFVKASIPAWNQSSLPIALPDRFTKSRFASVNSFDLPSNTFL